MSNKTCSKCGQPLSDTDVFCPNCGTPVEHSEAASSTTASAEKATTNTNSRVKSSSSSVKAQTSKFMHSIAASPLWKNLLSIWKDLFKSPSRLAEKYGNRTYWLEGLISIGILGLLSMLNLAGIEHVLNQLVSLSYGYGFPVHLSGWLYLIAFVIGIIIPVLVILFSWGITRLIYKKHTVFKDFLGSVGISCWYVSLGIVLGFLLGQVSATLEILVLCASGLLSLLSFYFSFLTTADLNPDQSLYTLILVAVLTVLLLCILCSLSFKALIGNLYQSPSYYYRNFNLNW